MQDQKCLRKTRLTSKPTSRSTILCSALVNAKKALSFLTKFATSLLLGTLDSFPTLFLGVLGMDTLKPRLVALTLIESSN